MTIEASSAAGWSSLFQRLCFLVSPKKSENPAKAPAPPLPPLLLLPPVDVDGAHSSTTRGEEFERVFRYFDENGDGKISPSELRSCLRTVGEELTPEEAEAVVESSDSDGDGLLGFEDFVRLVDGEGEDERARNLQEAYAMYAAGGGDGGITPKSLKRMLRKLGEPMTTEQCKAVVRRFDLNGDGVINFDEFKIMMM